MSIGIPKNGRLVRAAVIVWMSISIFVQGDSGGQLVDAALHAFEHCGVLLELGGLPGGGSFALLEGECSDMLVAGGEHFVYESDYVDHVFLHEAP